MILYFSDRQLRIMGMASSALPDGQVFYDDKLTDEVETGISTFECRVPFTDDTRADVVSMTSAGNYVLADTGENDNCRLFTIIETEESTEDGEVFLSAEDAGLDLLNEVCKSYEPSDKHEMAYYVKIFIEGGKDDNGTPTIDSAGTGFEIGINESDPDKKIKLQGLCEQTVTERLQEVAKAFDMEIYYRFTVETMRLTHKYVDIYAKRGSDREVNLYLDKEVKSIIKKTSIADLATALLVTGGQIDGAGSFKQTLDLSNYNYDDGDIYVDHQNDAHYLRSRDALQNWSRAVWNSDKTELVTSGGDLVKPFQYDTQSVEELFKQAKKELEKVREPAYTYEVQLASLPDGIGIGDRINVIDDAGGLYLSARLVKLEKCYTEGTISATLGDYKTRDSGISAQLLTMAQNFSGLSQTLQQTQTAVSATGVTADTTIEIRATDVDLEAGKATLTAYAVRNGADADMTGYSYKWTPGGETTRSISVSDLTVTYYCDVTWGEI